MSVRPIGTLEVVCMRHPAAHIPLRRVVVTRFDRPETMPAKYLD
jgi:hypothetical protein